MPDTVEQQLSAARDQLLDLGLGNKLLNYRPPKVSAVEIDGEPVEKLWRLLALQDTSVGFSSSGADRTAAAGLPAAANEAPETEEPSAQTAAHGADDTGEAAAPRDGAPRRLRTVYHDRDLQNRLLRLYDAARTGQEEMGLTVLYVAVGFLLWKPAERAQAVRAPVFLLPVAMERATAQDRFKIKATGEDPVFNPCLAKKLERDFRIAVPALPDSWQDINPVEVLGALRQAVQHQADWSVAETGCLGLFSFSKYAMYADMDAERWNDGQGILGNPLVRAMCGQRDALEPSPEGLPRPEAMDELEKPETTFQVMDADSSQQAAIAAVKRGHNLVIQGPPGTGKSQTIANILAEFLAAGKTVLFVSQKKAALEVVKSRLEKAGLGDFCMELHSTKATRTAMLAELERVLNNQPVTQTSNAQPFARLAALQQRLGDYVKNLHAPIGKSARTPFYCFGRLSQLANVPTMGITFEGCDQWDVSQCDAFRDSLSTLAGRLQETGPVSEHPWFGLRATQVTAQQQEALVGQAGALAEKAGAAIACAGTLGTALGLSAAQNLADAGRQLAVGALLVSADPVCAELIRKEAWNQMPPGATVLVTALREYGQRRDALQAHWDLPRAAALDLPGMRARAAQHTGLTRWLSRQYWRDRAAARGCMQVGYQPNAATRAADIALLDDLFQRKAAIASADESARSVFGEAWAGVQTAPDRLVGLSNWLVEARHMLAKGLLTEAGLALLIQGADRAPLAAAMEQMRSAAGAFRAAYATLRTSLLAKNTPPFPESPDTVTLAPLQQRAGTMVAAANRLMEIVLLRQVLEQGRPTPLWPFISKAVATSLEPELLLVCFEKQYLTDVLNTGLAQRDALRLFNGTNHENMALEFARLDRRNIQSNRGRIYALVSARRPDIFFGAAKDSQLGILQGEMRRKRGGRSIRRILRDAPEAVSRIKPCFMMSPLSVAQYLDPQSMGFDLVVFDEASQVEPSDALGAIARGKQLVLVGDSKQLPPTRLFASLESDAQNQAPEEGEAALTDMESILDRGEAVLPKLALRWHYRSRHESLISFSNSEFYNNQLIVFPSCHHGDPQYGLSLRYEPADMYDRGHSKTNRAQAARVAEAVFAHARECPDVTLGVAAFSAAQQQAILDEIETGRKANPALESFFAPNRPDPFFVKNLETIQGDERDVIFLSVGHGPAVPGQRVGSISNLNREGGWRRLNVLVTRARLRYVVFSSVVARDMDIKNDKAMGAQAFQRYLEFVETGRLPVIMQNDGEADSPFEEAVYDALTERGVQLRRQVGTAGYAIDMAVVDPEHPGRYLLGIECDGASYHSAATARDRDRLRQEVLEQLGWRFHRIWSTDWFRQPNEQITAVMASIAQAKAGKLMPRYAVDVGGPVAPTAVSEPCPRPDAVDGGPVALLPGMIVYCPFSNGSPLDADKFYTQPAAALVGLVVKIVGVEGPIHEDQLAGRISDCFSITRVGPRVRERIMTALASAQAGGKVRRAGAFVWPADMTIPPLRWRGELASRDFDTVAPEETALAVDALVRQQFAVPRDALAIQTLRAMGIPVSVKNKPRVEEQLDAMVKAGKFVVDSEHRLKPPNGS